MYVSELDRPWIESRFLFQGFEIQAQEELDEISRVCKYVYIETEVEYQDGHARPRTPLPFGAPAPDEFAAKRMGYEILDKFTAGHLQAPHYADQLTLEQELPEARGLVLKTRALIDTFMEDARFGRSLDTSGANEIVGRLVQSILRNPDALVCLNEIKEKDEYTALHSLRVCVLALAFGRHLEMSEADLRILGLGTLLHDIGKVKVPQELINKPGTLTAEEFDLMKRHVPLGVQILQRTGKVPPAAIDIARTHHERFDGSGYAFGLSGDDISLFGQIGAIVDSYDAITSDRSYHKGMSAHDALRKLYEWRRKDFHDKLVEQFIQCMGVYPIGSIVEMNTGSIGVVVSVNRLRRLRPRVALVLDADKRPLSRVKIVDLFEDAAQDRVEIRSVLPSNSFGINAIEYLPVAI